MLNSPHNSILLVDDNETSRYTLARHLRRADFQVVEAETGEGALREAQNGPDLVILDVKLPDISGYEVSRRLRLNPVTRSIPILQISATFTLSSDKVKGLEAGADGYLTGPVEPEELLANVRMLLRLKDAQDALAKSNEKLKSVLSSIMDVFFAIDVDFRFRELNPAAEKFFNRPAESLLGKSMLTEFPEALPADLVSHYETAFRTKTPFHFEEQSRIQPGSWWEGHVYPREDRLDIYLRDITERKLHERRLAETAETLHHKVEELQSTQQDLARARDQLRKQNEMLEQRVHERTTRLEETISDLETFSYSITHDMRAPLRAMQGFSSLLLNTHAHSLNPEGKDFLQRINNSANRLDMLIRDVLSYSNIVRAELPLVPIDADKLLSDILREYPGFQPPLANVRVQRPLPMVLGNEAFLTQCFSNLLSNAVKFVTPNAQPQIDVSAETNNGFVRIKFKDNGIGISSKHQARLFTLFQRAQSTYPGTGIGLAVVRKAVERMGGKVGVESASGTGSTFWVELHGAAT